MRLHQSLYVRSDGRVGHGMLVVVPSLLLRTTGRRTGTRRTTALAYARDGDNYVVVASNRATQQSPSRYLNVHANPEVELQVGRARLPGIARPYTRASPTTTACGGWSTPPTKAATTSTSRRRPARSPLSSSNLRPRWRPGRWRPGPRRPTRRPIPQLALPTRLPRLAELPQGADRQRRMGEWAHPRGSLGPPDRSPASLWFEA